MRINFQLLLLEVLLGSFLDSGQKILVSCIVVVLRRRIALREASRFDMIDNQRFIGSRFCSFLTRHGCLKVVAHSLA